MSMIIHSMPVKYHQEKKGKPFDKYIFYGKTFLRRKLLKITLGGLIIIFLEFFISI